MKRILVVYPDKCKGCERCKLHCSFFHFQEHNPLRAKIDVLPQNSSGGYVVTICNQCGLCMAACPIPGAIERNGSTGAIVVNKEKCTGCGQCVMACPYGMIEMDPTTNLASKCDLCGGNPRCVKTCKFGALGYVDVREAPFRRRSMSLSLHQH